MDLNVLELGSLSKTTSPICFKCNLKMNYVVKFDKGGEIRDKKTLNLSRNIVGFQVFGRCFSFFTLQGQLVAQQKHLLRVEEMQHADWLICLVWIQDGGITTN